MTAQLLLLPTLLPEGSLTDFHFLLTHRCSRLYYSETYFVSPAITGLINKAPNNILLKITLCICKVKKPQNPEAKEALYQKITFYAWLNINLGSNPTSLSKIYFSVHNQLIIFSLILFS